MTKNLTNPYTHTGPISRVVSVGGHTRRAVSLVIHMLRGTNRSGERGGVIAYLVTPASEFLLGWRKKKRANKVNGMEKKRNKYSVSVVVISKPWRVNKGGWIHGVCFGSSWGSAHYETPVKSSVV